MDLRHNTVLITGAARGNGRSIAVRPARHGANSRRMSMQQPYAVIAVNSAMYLSAPEGAAQMFERGNGGVTLNSWCGSRAAI